MLQKLIKWYRLSSVRTQLIFSFLVYFIIWNGILVFRHYWFDRQHETAGRLLFESLFMAFFITLFFEWKRVKELFTKKDRD
ncbi:MAG: hypothetical protein ABIN48_13755 [Ginsengibacter sp.]